MNRSLLLIALGPVQEFIEQARRTRDVWFGSWVLSHLSKKVAQTLPREGLIFPTGESLPSPELERIDPTRERISYSNQILVIVPDARAAITQAYGAFKQEIKLFVNKLDDLLQKDPDRIYKNYPDVDQREQIDLQLFDLFEFQYAHVDLPDDQHYAQQRKKLYQLYTARKNTRSFGSIRWDQSLPRPEREAKLPPAVRRSTKRSNKSSLDGWHTMVTSGDKSGENLSAVDLLKRKLNPHNIDPSYPEGLNGFPSTSHMAALAFAQSMQDSDSTKITQKWAEYIDTLEELDPRFTEFEQLPLRFRNQQLFFGTYDGSLIYESRLGDDIPIPNKESTSEQKSKYDSNLIDARKALRHFLGAKTPIPYYAIIAADGDKMGDLIDSITDVQTHRNLSKAVTDFAQAAAQILEEKYQAAVIYAGGDDVLALLPLHTVLRATKEISDLFVEYMQTLAEQQGVSTPTLSVGVAIVHHLEALQDSIQLARKAEKLAKKPRNALAIILSKRNGSDKTIVGQWNTTFYHHLNDLVKLHCQQTIPDGFIFEFDELLKRFDFGLINEPAELQQTLKIIEHEWQRILKRKQTQHAGKASFLAAEMINLLQSIIGYCASHASNSAKPDQYLRDFIAMNLVARELAMVQALFEKAQSQGVTQ
ncbi:type III-B CRISPR-associated protein Cas10/Cmr2 [Herpetosiphon gulosus]|uniref:GGDEF domain-containing protein n=1 Tax=Herpetosiphon gulosus TaxID=1973496 RepID=A0ABP9X6V3_9CHLR